MVVTRTPWTIGTRPRPSAEACARRDERREPGPWWQCRANDEQRVRAGGGAHGGDLLGELRKRRRARRTCHVPRHLAASLDQQRVHAELRRADSITSAAGSGHSALESAAQYRIANSLFGCGTAACRAFERRCGRQHRRDRVIRAVRATPRSASRRISGVRARPRESLLA